MLKCVLSILVFTIGDFSRADLAQACLHFICQDMAETVRLACQVEGLTNIYIAGAFPESKVIMKELDRTFAVQFAVGVSIAFCFANTYRCVL